MDFAPREVTERCRAWLAETLGDCAIGEPLEGASTATVVPVDAGDQRYVLKWFTWEDFVVEDPERVARELHGLDLAESAGIPAPRLVAADPSGAATGHPAVVMTAVAGAPLPRPADWPVAAGRTAARLHDLDARSPYRHTPYVSQPLVPDWAEDTGLWCEAVAVTAGLGSSTEAIIHRDLHRWNMHWHEGRLTGVVDWLTACRGPIGEDVGRVWLNEILEGEPAAGAAFRSAYVSCASRAWDARWEVQSVLDMLPVRLGDRAVHRWGDPVSRARLETCLRRALRLL